MISSHGVKKIADNAVERETPPLTGCVWTLSAKVPSQYSNHEPALRRRAYENWNTLASREQHPSCGQLRSFLHRLQYLQRIGVGQCRDCITIVIRFFTLFSQRSAGHSPLPQLSQLFEDDIWTHCFAAQLSPVDWPNSAKPAWRATGRAPPQGQHKLDRT